MKGDCNQQTAAGNASAPVEDDEKSDYVFRSTSALVASNPIRHLEILLESTTDAAHQRNIHVVIDMIRSGVI